MRTPAIPAGTSQISFGVALYGQGTLITDDYSMTDATVAASPVKCTAGVACAKGAWQVLPFPSPVRAIHTVLMYNGKVLLVAGSGNDPDEFAAGHLRVGGLRPGHGQVPGHTDARRLLLRRARPARGRQRARPRRQQGLPGPGVGEEPGPQLLRAGHLLHLRPGDGQVHQGEQPQPGPLVPVGDRARQRRRHLLRRPRPVGQAATDIEYFKYDGHRPTPRRTAARTGSGCPRPTSTATTRATPTTPASGACTRR